MILSTRRAVFIGDLRSRVSWASIVDPRRVMTTTPADRAIGRRCWDFWACRAALEREEHAARVYGGLASRLEATARERAETRRRSHLRALLS
jgi:hypothetical protein